MQATQLPRLLPDGRSRAGLIAKRFGYKGGILVGLALIAAGAFWFIPAVNIGAYWAFLLGLFVIAAGMTCLETIANPYATVLGPPEAGPTRINIAQTTNGAGWILGPIVGGHFVFSGGDGVNANSGLTTPYLGIALFVALLLIIFAVSRVPDLHAVDESRRLAAESKPAQTLRSSNGCDRSHISCDLWDALLFCCSDSGTGMDFASHERGPVQAGEIWTASGRLRGCFPFRLKELGNVPAQALHSGHCVLSFCM